jgi:hypothetical protein
VITVPTLAAIYAPHPYAVVARAYTTLRDASRNRRRRCSTRDPYRCVWLRSAWALRGLLRDRRRGKLERFALAYGMGPTRFADLMAGPA